MSATASPPPLPVETRSLADGVFLAAVGEDVVVLDLRSDGYGCLPGLSDQISISDRGVTADLGLLGALADAALIIDAAPVSSTPLPALPCREIAYPGRPASVLGLPRLAQAVLAHRRLGADPTVETLIRALPDRPPHPSDAGRVARIVRRFQILSPWIPEQGACLYRAFVLLTLLRRSGQNAVWVFGVRTWPFNAHCWLQLGDVVLDDNPERVGLYTPILAVR